MKKIYSNTLMAAVIAGAAFSASAQMQTEASYTVTPAREKVSSISNIIFTFPEDMEVTIIDDDADSNVLFGTIPEIYWGDGVRIVCSAEDNMFIVSPAATFGGLTDEGNYTLMIPEKTFALNGVPYTKGIQMNYEIDNSYEPEKYTVAPKANVLDAIEEIQINFPNATEVKENYAAFPTITDAKGVTYANFPSVSGTTYTIKAKESIKTAGNYVVTVPAAALIVDGATLSDDIVLQYSVVNDGPDFEANIFPAPGKLFEFGSQIVVEFKGGEVPDYQPTGTNECIYLQKAVVDEEGNTSYERVITFMPEQTLVKANTISLIISPEQEIASGNYQLVFGAGCYSLDGTAGEELTFDYTIQAVNPTFAPKAAEVTELTKIIVGFPGFTEVKEFTEANAVAKLINAKTGEFASTLISSVVDNTVEFIVKDQEALVAGQSYTLTIDPYYFELDGQIYNKGISQTWFYMPELPEFGDEVTPADGSKFTQLSVVTVKFAAPEGAEAVTVTLNELSTLTAPYITVDGERMGTAQKVDLNEGLLTLDFGQFSEAGEAVVTIPGALYNINGIPGIDLTYNYTIADVKYSISPKANEITEGTFDGLTFTFAEGAEVKELAYEVRIYNLAGEAIRCLTSVESNVYTIKAIDELAAGIYTFVIPANTLSVDGVVINNDITITKMYTPDVLEAEYTAEPASGSTIAAITNITVTFADDAVVAINSEATTLAIMPKLIDNEGWESFLPGFNAEGNKLTIDCSDYPYTAPGSATVVFQGTGYTLNGKPGFDIMLTYTIDPESGIANVTVANGADIYTVSGVKVAKAVRGINIINGQKVIVK